MNIPPQMPAALTLAAAMACFPPTVATAQADATRAPATIEINGSTAPASFSELAKDLMPAVVNISTSQRVVEAGLPEFPEGSPLERFNEFFGRDDDGFRRESSLGSGFVIDPSGVIVTNNHVIDGADEIEINFADGSVMPATLVGTDAETDLAVLRVEPDDPLPFVPFGDSDAANVGDWVIAIGNPFGLGGSVSAGIISARNRDINAGRYDDFIQTDAAINRGNSGGPLFNLEGEVVGVNTAIISPTGGSVGIGFSVPSNLADRIVDQILTFGKARRGWLGVNIQGVDEGIARSYGLNEARGVVITEIVDGGPADLAGLKVGDLMLSFNGETIDESRELTRWVAEAEIGSTLDVEIVRNKRRQTLEIEMGELGGEDEDTEDAASPEVSEPFVSANAFGVTFGPVTDEARRRHQIAKSVAGVLVEKVDPKGPAAGKLIEGDVVIEIQFTEISSPAEADDVLQNAETLDYVLFRVSRRGRTAFYSVTREPRS